MALLIGSLILNVVLLVAVHKLITRAHIAEANEKMYRDDKYYWMNQHQRAIEELDEYKQ